MDEREREVRGEEGGGWAVFFSVLIFSAQTRLHVYFCVSNILFGRIHPPPPKQKNVLYRYWYHTLEYDMTVIAVL